MDQRLNYRVDDMKERKFKLFISKSATTHVGDARLEFNRGESLKKMHLDQLSDRQIESFLFSKTDQSKGNEILNFLCIIDQKDKAKGILSIIKRLPIPENDRNISCNEEDHDSSQPNLSGKKSNMNRSKVYNQTEQQQTSITDKKIHSSQNLPCDLSKLDDHYEMTMNRTDTQPSESRRQVPSRYEKSIDRQVNSPTPRSLNKSLQRKQHNQSLKKKEVQSSGLQLGGTQVTFSNALKGSKISSGGAHEINLPKLINSTFLVGTNPQFKEQTDRKKFVNPLSKEYSQTNQ